MLELNKRNKRAQFNLEPKKKLLSFSKIKAQVNTGNEWPNVCSSTLTRAYWLGLSLDPALVVSQGPFCNVLLSALTLAEIIMLLEQNLIISPTCITRDGA